MTGTAREMAAAMLAPAAGPVPARMLATFEAYLASWRDGDGAARAALFAPEATVEDPVGTPVHAGLAAIRAFWAGAEAGGFSFAPRLELFVPCGGEALVRFVMRLARAGEAPVDLTVHEVVRFDADARILSIRAFFSPESFAPVPASEAGAAH